MQKWIAALGLYGEDIARFKMLMALSNYNGWNKKIKKPCRQITHINTREGMQYTHRHTHTHTTHLLKHQLLHTLSLRWGPELDSYSNKHPICTLPRGLCTPVREEGGWAG